MSVPAAESTPGVGRLRRVLTLWDLIFYGIVAVTPSAPATVYGLAEVKSGGYVVVTILAAMVAMVLTAISYGRMAALYPSAGSAYAYVSRGIHPYLGFVAGWAMLLDYMLIPLFCTLYGTLALQRAFPILPFPLGSILFAGGITLLNLRGIRSTARANQVLLVLMGFVLLSFIVLAIKYIAVRYGIPGLFSTQPFYRPGTFHLRTIASATSFAAFTYLGFDAVTTMAEDVKNPRKNVMLAAVSVCLFTGIFGGLLVYLGQLVWPNYTTFTNINTAFVDVTGRVGGVTLLKATALLLFVANVGAGLTSQVGAARLLFGMGRENVIPARYFARLHPVRNTPHINIILLGVAGFCRGPGDQLRAGCGTAELRRLPRLHGSESSGDLEILGSPGGTGWQKFFVRYGSPAPWLPVLFRDMAGAGQPGKDCRQPLAGGRLLCPGHANGLVQASDRDVGSVVVRIMEKAEPCA